jgi:TfoX/Sxy family transcriptional regulator of competence genes
MVESYRQTLHALLTRLASTQAPGTAIACKHFFGGAAGYADGRIFISLTPAGLALKLPEEARLRLIEEGAKPLRYFADGPIKKNYVVVPDGLAHDDGALAPWIDASIRFVSAAPTRR